MGGLPRLTVKLVERMVQQNLTEDQIQDFRVSPRP